MEEEASSHPEQADPAARAAPAGVLVGARDIDRLLAALAQYAERQVAPPVNPPVNQNVGLLEKFKKLYPTEFEGTFKPQEAEDWLKTVERVLTAMGVTDEQKVTLATFTLKGQALLWWEGSQRLLSAPLPGIQPPVPQVITWARFVKAFNDRYCPVTYRFQQEADFINLKQGSMSVAEYEAKFNALSAYATDMVNIEEKKGRRFRGGLEDNVRTRMTIYKEKGYADLIETTKMIGKDVEELFSQGEGKQQGSQSYEASKPSFGKGSSSSGRGTPFKCYRCGSPDHRMRDCPESGKGFKCFRCGEMGHIATHCTKPQGSGASSIGSVPVGRGMNVGRPVGRGGGTGGSTAPRRVFAMTRQNVQATPNVCAFE
ncbi:uncharacterized protein LOC131303129 [Rhododendron vialii]|uniref:uncharacterized protein LOC131303129 n=1 Tax=Rhododendron vialii TaxID=182163 RepID=UPI00265E3357|nr:uncharacterized protein LOC131303129 [Rhododendron vialii]